jgi:hypothetical protein
MPCCRCRLTLACGPLAATVSSYPSLLSLPVGLWPRPTHSLPNLWETHPPKTPIPFGTGPPVTSPKRITIFKNATWCACGFKAHEGRIPEPLGSACLADPSLNVSRRQAFRAGGLSACVGEPDPFQAGAYLRQQLGYQEQRRYPRLRYLNRPKVRHPAPSARRSVQARWTISGLIFPARRLEVRSRLYQRQRQDPLGSCPPRLCQQSAIWSISTTSADLLKDFTINHRAACVARACQLFIGFPVILTGWAG